MKSLKLNPLKATMLLIIAKPEIPEEVLSYARNHGFIEKPEFHVSIIGLQNGKKIIGKYGADETVLEQVRALVDDFQWQVVFEPEYFIIEKYYEEDELLKSGYENIPPQWRRTIIQKIRLPDIESFYEKLTALTGIDFEIPFAHIMLFSWSDYASLMTQGIGLYSEDDFDRYCKGDISIV